MKKTALIIVLIASAFTQQTFAQTDKLPMQEIITDYLNLKNALTADNADSAKVAANNLSINLKNVEVGKFSLSQQKIWIKYYEMLASDAAQTGYTADISKQRKHFSNLSSNFYKMVKAMKMNKVDLFYQYCPMADSYWISEDSKITNPYYGKKMSTCGSTKEILKANN